VYRIAFVARDEKNKKESKSLICDKNPHFHELLEHYMDDI
jgi:hypothetical protein